MSKLILSITATSLIGLASCVPPPPGPPPRFRPVPQYSEDNSSADDSLPYDTRPEAYDQARRDVGSPTPQPSTTQPTTPGSYPIAERTANPNQVLSPYEPYNVIDVEGFKSGQLARDPSNQKIFRIP